MLAIKIGSIGEMPPSTRGTDGLACAMALPALIVIFANRLQSGSISGSQCDLLLGSFQIMTASIISCRPLPDTQRRLPLGHRPGGKRRLPLLGATLFRNRCCAA